MSEERRPALERRLLLGLVLLKLLLLLLLGNRYGFHRDELYYLVGGRQLDFGYVDHPFVVPWLAHLSESLFGLSLIGLRLFSTVASAAVVYLAGVLAANLGGGRSAQLLAGVATLLIPFHLMVQNIFQTVPIDHLSWALACLVLVLLLRSGNSRWWVVFGVISGIGLLTKYTFLVLGAATCLGLLLTSQRRELTRPWIYLGGVVALLLFLPNLLWQIRHGWPSLEFMASMSADNRFPPPLFLGLQMVFMGPFSLPLFLAGFVHLFSRDEARFRPLGVTAAFVLLSFLVAQSKPYYLASIYPLLFAAGAVWLERRSLGGFGTASGLRRHWPFLLLLGNLSLVPIVMPVLPTATYARLHDGFPHPEFGEMIGWPELVEAVGTAYQQLPREIRQNTVIVTSNYGSAAALDLFGHAHGLPSAFSFQNSYYYWSKPSTIDSVLTVGFRRKTVESYFGKVVELGVITNRAGVDNYEAGESFFLATDPKVSPAELREQLKYFR